MNNEFTALYCRQNKHMKKLLIPICLIVGMNISSCKKEDKKDEKKPAGNIWNIDGTVYTGTSTTKNDNAYSFYNVKGENISFYFKSYPTASGTYRINDDITTDADEVDILLGTFSPVMVGGPQKTSAKVTVTVSAGKINIKCTDVPIDKEDGQGGSLGSGTLSADVTSDL